MDSSPASSFEMGEAEFALEFLIVAFDAPAQFRGIDENFESQYLVGSRSASGHSISSHSSGCGAVSLRSRVAGRIRTAAKREGRVWLEPSRQDTSRQASFGSVVASAWPRPADDRRRAAYARACVRVRSRAWAAEAHARRPD